MAVFERGDDLLGRLPGAFMNPGTSSFVEFLSSAAPHLLPAGRGGGDTGGLPSELAPHGTTVVAAQFAGGVVMAGDRRATAGNIIAHRDMQKVFPADAYSVVGIAGAVGAALEMVRLFQLELEHYEKLEGTLLSLAGKANRLSGLVRGNIGAAMQGMAVVPLFAGFDLDADPATGERPGRIFSYEITGGLHEEQDYDAVGSGSLFAKSALKKRYRPGLSGEEVVRLCVESLYDAADDDSATGGPDMARGIYPVVTVVDTDGVRVLAEEEVQATVVAVVEGRAANVGG